ncbi:NADH-quinone oxidoreductase subunit K [Gimesia fumaroli]|uniref:NAD(P)H-quinone oxidoreductase subunit 4L, chloroplastic n=1 Tax=Gimesia fumaroli TaxID=2527976 RepID=A0A518I6U4_9PLAN|nr:NADH-quinone oxidoreductase subunit K [Gimesia fumaroli]QDV48822.1 NAD(P)H-quinone oxidoreductase subunit 4L, chloroplastic [Gimesia fumaroli]
MILMQSAPLLHNHLMIAVTLIVLGFLGMLLQRNRLATVFSLLLWLQGAGLVFAAYGPFQNSRAGNFYFLIVALIVITLLCTLAALIFHARRYLQQEQVEPKSREGTISRG